jgi:hypothetical protein
MSIRKIEQIEKLTSHPLEEFFNIEPMTTKVTKTERKTELLPYQEFDKKDGEIEESYQEIMDAAMNGYENLQEMIDTADTKFAARLAEVSVQHLNVALAAAGKKAHLKENKDKLVARQKIGPTKQTNNIIVMDRNEMLKRLMSQDQDAIDVESVEILPSKE